MMDDIKTVAGAELELRITPPEFNITFHDENKEIGRLWWDKKELQFKFEGELAESAQKFVDFVVYKCQSWFEEKYGN